MAVERITYRANGKSFIGALVHDERVAGKRPLMLIAPNWLGVSDVAIKRAQMMTGSRYIGFEKRSTERQLSRVAARRPDRCAGRG